MADMRGSSGVCSDTCGCSTPCTGGKSCRCYTSTGVPSADDSSVEHKKCSCGEHCGCNPCTCTKRMSDTSGCKCAEGCSCTSCA